MGLLFLFLCILLSFECFSHIIYKSYNISTCYWLFDSLFCCVGFLMFCLLLGFKARNGSKACENIECGSFKHNLVIVCQDISLSKSTNNLTLWKQLVCTFHYFIYFLPSFAYTSLSFGFVVFKKIFHLSFGFAIYFLLIPFFVGLFVFSLYSMEHTCDFLFYFCLIELFGLTWY